MPTPTPSLTTYAADTFSRTLSQTWGEADQGGNYAGFYCTNDDMNVTGTAATVLLPDPHNPEICPKDSTVDTNYRGGYLTNVSAQDVDVRFRVATATLATSDNINVGFDARRVSGFTSYRGQVRLTTGNQVWLQADTVINNTMTPLGANTRAATASVATGAFIWVRAQVTGTNPTTIRMKAWNDGSPEPATWAYTTTDSTAVLQAPGAAGLLGWLSAAWNQGPITVSFDDFNVTSPISGTVPAAPVANFSATPVAGTLGVNFSNTSTGGTPDTLCLGLRRWDRLELGQPEPHVSGRRHLPGQAEHDQQRRLVVEDAVDHGQPAPGQAGRRVQLEPTVRHARGPVQRQLHELALELVVGLR